SESSVSCPSLSRMACLKLGCSDDSRLTRNLVPSSTPSAPSMIAAASPRPSAIPPAASTGMAATASHTIATTAMVVSHLTRPPLPFGKDPAGPGRRGSPRLGYAPGHECYLAARGVGALHIRLDVLLRPRPGKGDHGGPQRERRCERIVLDIEQQEVQGKRPICK